MAPRSNFYYFIRCMSKIYIIRHGETDYNKEGRYLGQTDLRLNEQGIRQAHALVAKIQTIPFNAIYSSPLKRSLETANVISDYYKLPIQTIKNFTERSIGVYEGLTKDEAQTKFPKLYARNITRLFDEAPPGGETIDQVLQRVHSGLEILSDKYMKKSDNILLVTHGFIAKAVHKYFNPDISEIDFFDYSLDNCEIAKYDF